MKRLVTLLSIAALAGITMSRIEGTELKSARLENGLEVLLAPKEGVPLVTIEIAIRAGSFIESPDMDGLTHLHEHMFFKANKAIPDQETYLKRLDELGMSWNGSTSNEVVRYFFTLPSHLLEEGLVFMRDAIQTPLFLEEELEKERKVVIGEYDRWEADPTTHLRKAVNEGLFRKYYSRKNPIGAREVILGAGRDKIEFIQNEYYVPNNAALILSGEFDPPAAMRLVESVFAGWESRPDPFERNAVPAHPPVLASQHRIVIQPVTNASALLGWHGPSVTEDPRATVVADVLSSVLAQPTSRFQKNLVDAGHVATASLGYYTQKFVGPIYLGFETQPDKLLEALRGVRAEIEALAEGGSIGEDELARAKRDIVHAEIFEREKARDFALALGFWWSIGGMRYYFDYPEMVQQVTLDDLRDFARTYLLGHHVAGVLISEASRAALGLDAESVRDALSPGSARGEGGGMHSETLANGASLVVKTLGAGEVAAFQVFFRNPAERVTEAAAGIEQLLVQTLVDRFRRDFVNELNELGIRVTFHAQADFTVVGVECLRPAFGQAVQLLAGALLRGELRAEDVERNRELMLVDWSRAMDHPQQKVSYVVNRTFYPEDHPYRAYPGGTEDSLKSLSIEDLDRHRPMLLQGRNMMFVAVVSMSGEETRTIVEGAFGGVPAGEAAAPPELAELGGDIEDRLTVEKKAIPSNYVLGKFRAPGPRDPDHDALRLALRILSRKLWLEVRSKRALTYAVGSNLIRRQASMGYVTVSTTQPNEALRVIYQTLDELVATPLPETEIRAAALTFSTSEYLAQESPGQQASEIGWEVLVHEDPARAFTLAQRLESVTAADVQRVLGKYVRAIHFGVIGPAAELDRELFLSR